MRELRAAGVPAAVSNSAGTFVCNHVFYGLMHRLATQPVGPRRARRLHPHSLPAGAGGALSGRAVSLALDTLVDALRIAVATALAVRDDVARDRRATALRH